MVNAASLFAGMMTVVRLPGAALMVVPSAFVDSQLAAFARSAAVEGVPPFHTEVRGIVDFSETLIVLPPSSVVAVKFSASVSSTRSRTEDTPAGRMNPPVLKRRAVPL